MINTLDYRSSSLGWNNFVGQGLNLLCSGQGTKAAFHLSELASQSVPLRKWNGSVLRTNRTSSGQTGPLLKVSIQPTGFLWFWKLHKV